jgi:hypothetical protein
MGKRRAPHRKKRRDTFVRGCSRTGIFVALHLQTP